MTIGGFCNREVIVITQGESILEAVELMRDRHVGSLVVVEAQDGGNAPVAMLTDRDIVIEILAEGIEPRSVLVGDVMSRELETAREDEEIADVLKRMRQKGVRRMPVVDVHGLLQGLITVDDLIALLAEQMSDLAALISSEQRHEQKSRP